MIAGCEVLGQFPNGISPTDSSPNDISPKGHFFIYLNVYLPLVKAAEASEFQQKIYRITLAINQILS